MIRKFTRWTSLAVLCVLSAGAAQAASSNWLQDVTRLQIQSEIRTGLFDWKVGDTSEYKMSLAQFAMVSGTMKKFVASDEGHALWINSEANMMGQAQKAEMLIQKSDGKVLKLIVNGQEQQPDTASDMQVVSQDVASITVPAGTFQCVHIKAKSSEYPNIEVWMNPSETVMEGMIKQLITHPQYGDIIMELTKFIKI